MQPPNLPPQTEKELLQRVAEIAGFTLGELAEMAGIAVPNDFRKHKGWSGQLLELWLGATAGSKPQQDFVNLGIELKSLPITTQGKVLETTYVCYAHLMGIQGQTWENCNVKNKLQQVLWLPIVGERQIPPFARVVGTGFLWSPSETENQQLKTDWEEHMDCITLGGISALKASQGEVLQIRPKAADGSQLTEAVGESGKKIKTRPRGFYLRKQFTQHLLDQYFFPTFQQ